MGELELFQELQKVTMFDPVKKTVHWSVPQQGRTVGKTVGTVANGYIVVHFMYHNIKLHRYIYWLETGRIDDVVDHADHDTLGNRNLRGCSHKQNMQNRKKTKRNKSGFKGVVFHQGKYRAVIRTNGVQKHIGMYDTAKEASDAYYRVAQQIFGEFANRG